jgi:hypothetical protein
VFIGFSFPEIKPRSESFLVLFYSRYNNWGGKITTPSPLSNKIFFLLTKLGIYGSNYISI